MDNVHNIHDGGLYTLNASWTPTTADKPTTISSYATLQVLWFDHKNICLLNTIEGNYMGLINMKTSEFVEYLVNMTKKSNDIDNTENTLTIPLIKTATPFTISPRKYESIYPVAYRLSKCVIPFDGTILKLQGLHVWSLGNESGEEWRDIETHLE